MEEEKFEKGSEISIRRAYKTLDGDTAVFQVTGEDDDLRERVIYKAGGHLYNHTLKYYEDRLDPNAHFFLAFEEQ